MIPRHHTIHEHLITPSDLIKVMGGEKDPYRRVVGHSLSRKAKTRSIRRSPRARRQTKKKQFVKRIPEGADKAHRSET